MHVTADCCCVDPQLFESCMQHIIITLCFKFSADHMDPCTDARIHRVCDTLCHRRYSVIAAVPQNAAQLGIYSPVVRGGIVLWHGPRENQGHFNLHFLGKFVGGDDFLHCWKRSAYHRRRARVLYILRAGTHTCKIIFRWSRKHQTIRRIEPQFAVNVSTASASQTYIRTCKQGTPCQHDARTISVPPNKTDSGPRTCTAQTNPTNAIPKKYTPKGFTRARAEDTRTEK